MNNHLEAVTEDVKVKYIPLEMIRPNPYQPRKIFDKLNLEELASSIKEFGVIQPISVRFNGANYELVAGERRLRASKIAGLLTIPSIVINVSDKNSAYMALMENIQREDLNYFEIAEGYQNLIYDYGLTQEEIAGKLGKSQSNIANKLRVLRLSPKVKKALIENSLTERHARALLKAPDEEIQLNMLNRIIEENLNVNKTEQMVDQMINTFAGVNTCEDDKIVDKKIDEIENNVSVLENERIKKQSIKRYIKDIRIFTNTISQAVDIMQKSGVSAKLITVEKEDKLEITIEIPTQ